MKNLKQLMFVIAMSFAASAMAMQGKDAEIQRLEREVSQAQAELQRLQDAQNACIHDMQAAQYYAPIKKAREKLENLKRELQRFQPAVQQPMQQGGPSVVHRPVEQRPSSLAGIAQLSQAGGVVQRPMEQRPSAQADVSAITRQRQNEWRLAAQKLAEDIAATKDDIQRAETAIGQRRAVERNQWMLDTLRGDGAYGLRGLNRRFQIINQGKQITSADSFNPSFDRGEAQNLYTVIQLELEDVQ